MAIQIITHDCDKCKLVPYIMELKREFEEDDNKVYERIQTQLDNAQQAADPSALENLPCNISEEDKQKFIELAKKNHEDAKALLKEWWEVMMEKYGIDQSAKYNYDLHLFYHCIDPKTGIADIHGQFHPKDEDDQ